MTTKRYLLQIPSLADMQNELEPGITIVAPSFAQFTDVTFDEKIVDESAVDETLAKMGCIPDPFNTSMGVKPFLGLIDAGGALWEISVDGLGILKTSKQT